MKKISLTGDPFIEDKIIISFLDLILFIMTFNSDNDLTKEFSKTNSPFLKKNIGKWQSQEESLQRKQGKSNVLNCSR